jgi:hypothetical protein
MDAWNEATRLAEMLTKRLRLVYRDDYIAKVARDEPDSLLGLLVRLEEALERRKDCE